MVMKKSSTCMLVTGNEEISGIHDMIVIALINHYKSMKKLHGKDATLYSKTDVVVKRHWLFFTKVERRVLSEDDTEYQERLEESIDKYINTSEFHYRSLKRLKRLDKFIKKCYEDNISFELSLSDYEYIRLWNESPNAHHTIYNASLD